MPFQKEIDAAQAQLDLSNNERKIFLSKSEAAVAKLQATKDDISGLTDTIHEQQRREKQIKKELSQFERDLQANEKELEVLWHFIVFANISRPLLAKILCWWRKWEKLVRRKPK